MTDKSNHGVGNHLISAQRLEHIPEKNHVKERVRAFLFSCGSDKSKEVLGAPGCATPGSTWTRIGSNLFPFSHKGCVLPQSYGLFYISQYRDEIAMRQNEAAVSGNRCQKRYQPQICVIFEMLVRKKKEQVNGAIFSLFFSSQNQ